jgi:hypothetical protein
MKVIHIGLPKTATTTLQRYTFPRLQKLRLIGEYNPPAFLATLKRINRGYFSEQDVLTVRQEVDALDRALISLEGLVGTDPQSWLEQCERNLRLFGADSTILITLREPKAYLRSVYQQVVHQGNVVKPEYFFLKNAEYERCRFLPEKGNLAAFNVDAFDYELLLTMYRERFAKVVVVAMEVLQDMDFLGSIFAIDADQKKQLKQQFVVAPPQNEAYSRLSMSFTFFREQLFRGLGAKTMGSEDLRLELFLDQDRGTAPNRKFMNRILRLLHRHVAWRKLMQKVVNKWGSKDRWELPVDLYLGRHMVGNSMYFSALLKDGGVRVLRGQQPDLTVHPGPRPANVHSI